MICVLCGEKCGAADMNQKNMPELSSLAHTYCPATKPEAHAQCKL